jgi:hypothetical protein
MCIEGGREVKSMAIPKRPKTPRNPAGREGLPVSLYPLSFKDAVAGLAQVKPIERENEKPKAKPKKAKG